MLDIYKARGVEAQLRRTVLFTGSIALGLALSILYQPAPFRNGLLLGSIVGIVYIYLIFNRLIRTGDMAPDKAVAFMRVGFIMRLTLVMAVMYLTISTPLLDVYGVAFGMFIAPMISVIDFNISLIKDYRTQLTQKDKN